MLRDALPNVNGKLPGPKAQAWLARCKRALPDAIRSDYPVVIERGEGAAILDVDGNVFLDWTGGVGVLNIGHCNPEVMEAVDAQAHRYFHSMMAVITHPAYIELIEKLNAIVPVRGNEKQTMLVNNGAEAIENAVKIAKAYTKRPNIIVFSGAYHGRTSLTMAMTAKKSYSLGMGPFPDGVFRVEYPNMYRKPYPMTDAEAIDYYVRALTDIFAEGTPAEYVSAIVVEPVQGEGGFIPAPMEWVKAVRKICDETGILLVVDEVQCGFARSGKFFVSDYWKDAGCAPDILACAKSIAAGLPLGAVTAAKEIMDSVPHGVIGGTFSGNAIACAAAKRVIEIIERDQLADRAVQLSEKVVAMLAALQKEYPEIGDVRGYGSMLGIEFVHAGKEKAPDPALTCRIVDACLANGLIVMRAGLQGNVIRFLYPLVITNAQMDASIAILRQAIVESIAKGGRNH